MVRGGCKGCGQRTTNDRLCNDCQRLERRDFFTAGGNDNGDGGDRDDGQPVECTACGREYTFDGSNACPDCGARRRRYVGPLPGESENEKRDRTDATAVTDGGTDTESAYVVPTGSGYLGTYTVSDRHKVSISTAALADRNWPGGASVHAVDHDDGVALVRRRLEGERVLASYQLSTRYDGSRVCLGQDAVEMLEVTAGDDVRVYDLEVTDGRDGLLVVDADDDPRIATDGGCESTTPDLEFVFEYTTIDGRCRRMTIIPDTGGEAWRILHERRDGEWRETGREPISNVHVQIRGHLEGGDDDDGSDDLDAPAAERGQPTFTDGGHSPGIDRERYREAKQTIARLEKLATAHEQFDWTDVPDITTAEAAAWATRLREARDVLEVGLEEAVDDAMAVDVGCATTSVRGPDPAAVRQHHQGGDGHGN